MGNENKPKKDNRKSFPGIILLFVIGLLFVVLFQNMSSDKNADVAFSHQVEHLVNLDLLNEGDSKKTSLNDNLVTFHGVLRNQYTELGKDRYKYLTLLDQYNQYTIQKEGLRKDLGELKGRLLETVQYFYAITGFTLPRNGLQVVSKQYDTSDTNSEIFIKRQSIPSEGVNLMALEEEFGALHKSPDPINLQEFGSKLRGLVAAFRSPQLGIGSQVMKKSLRDAERSLDKLGSTNALSSQEALATFQTVLGTLDEVANELRSEHQGVRFYDLRATRNYLEFVDQYQTVDTELAKTHASLDKARQKVQNVVWFYNNQEISSRGLEKKDPDEFHRWFVQAGEMWEGFAKNPGAPFKAVDQPRNLVLEKKFRSEEQAPNYLNYFFTFLPLILIGMLLYFVFSRQMKGMGSGAMNFGKSPAKMFQKNLQAVTFDDVAGIEEAKEELEEIVDFLKDPRKFTRLGARIPKGVLLVGPPGTGKTLIARAVAGEAGVPFFSISGSDFVEMFVGVGASRVRDLFSSARKNAPCIIFIDEIDAVGRHRGSGLGGGHDEREQTLNQLLVEFDGFDAHRGIIVIAATNRPDVLDKALLRPGRFDRQVNVDLPDYIGRLSILKVHIRKVRVGNEVNLKEIALKTQGCSGADLDNIINEAALLAARKQRKFVIQDDLIAALDKVVYGKERKSMALEEEDRVTTAWHEAGHAYLAMHLNMKDEVQGVSIIPRGFALGVTVHTLKKNRVSYRAQELKDRLVSLMGGRVAEEIINKGDPTNGAQMDFKMATDTARSMVCLWGMSDKVGRINYEEDNNGGFGFRERPYSEETALLIDSEIKSLLDEAYARAQQILTENRDKLELIANMLLKFEKLDRDDLIKIMNDEWDPQDKQAKLDQFEGTKEQAPPPVPEELKKGKKKRQIRPKPAT